LLNTEPPKVPVNELRTQNEIVIVAADAVPNDKSAKFKSFYVFGEYYNVSDAPGVVSGQRRCKQQGNF
jgi:hypothetical protein